MIALSFRVKLLLAMMALVAGVTGATNYVTQLRVDAWFRQTIDTMVGQQVMGFSRLQQLRLRGVKQKCLALNRPRLRAALEESDPVLLYDETTLLDLQDVLLEPDGGGAPAEADAAPRASFLCFLDAKGQILPPPATKAARLTPAVRRSLEPLLSRLRLALTNGPAFQQVGYLAPELTPGQPALHEVVLTSIAYPDTQQTVGALILGFPLAREAPSSDVSPIQSGVWLEGTVYSSEIPAALRPLVAQEAGKALARPDAQLQFTVQAADAPAGVYLRPLNAGSSFPPAYQVCVYSLAGMLKEKARLRASILSFGALALGGALAISLLLSHGLAVPVLALVRGTEEIQRGNFAVKVPVRSRDELGRLAGSFNEMAEGLALKEKYRSVLNMVADKKVALEMIEGRVALGGETREISVLFCDIRGFTALTLHMDPAEVIQMLNEHMTALTRVVYENDGVVDKFVGDLIMAIFGAPKSYGRDSWNAAHCARRMIEARSELNQTSRYQITVGIGVATGPAVAGCMGSSDRLNYTVLGERVNLAARLCSKAGKMDVVIDETTRRQLAEQAEVEELPGLELKGFTGKVPAYRLLGLQAPAPAKAAATTPASV